MKFRLFYMTILFCLLNNTYAMEPDMRILLSGESMEHGTASTVGVYAGSDTFYGGLSLSYIKSSEVIQYDNRKTIYPVYFFMGVTAPGKVSPFIETGMDLPEAFIDELLNNEEKSEAQADYYFSGGVRLKISEKLSLSLYAKQYHFIFRENIYAPTVKKRPHSYGLGVSIGF